jgi:hypothetical protein
MGVGAEFFESFVQSFFSSFDDSNFLRESINKSYGSYDVRKGPNLLPATV